MKNYYNKIKSLVLKMDLSEKEKDQYLLFFSKNINVTEEIYNFYLQKLNFVRSNEKVLWDQICQKEYSFLENVSIKENTKVS